MRAMEGTAGVLCVRTNVPPLPLGPGKAGDRKLPSELAERRVETVKRELDRVRELAGGREVAEDRVTMGRVGVGELVDRAPRRRVGVAEREDVAVGVGEGGTGASSSTS